MARGVFQEIRHGAKQAWLGRQRADENQHQSGKPSKARQRRHFKGNRNATIRRQPPHQLAALADLEARKQRAGQEKRDDVIEQPEQQQRANHHGCGQEARQRKQNGAIKNANAARHIGRKPRHIGSDVNAQKMQKAEPFRRRQQGVEDHGGDCDIGCGQRHLGQRDAKAGQVNLMPEKPDMRHEAR